MALTQISTQGIKDGTISSVDLADQSVTLAKLPHGTSSNDGKFLRANNGADPTFETVSSIGGGTGVDFDDNVKARFGNSQDLQIFHDSNNSFISESGTGNLVISTTSGSIRIEKNTGEPMIFANVDGAVELYHDGSKKFHTFSEGVTLFGDVFFDNPINAGKDLEWDASQDRLEFKDGVSAVFGASADLQIYHSSNESRIQNTTDKPLKIINGGNAGMLIQNQNSFDLEIKTNAEDAIKCIANAGVELYHNNSKKLETTSTGVTVTGDLLATGLFKNDTVGEGLHNTATGAKFFSNNSNDTHLEHGSNAQVKLSFISSSSTFRGAINGDANGMMILTGASGEEKGINCIANGATELYHNNSKKLETSSNGLTVTGQIQINNSGGALRFSRSGYENYVIQQSPGFGLDFFNETDNRSELRLHGDGDVRIPTDVGRFSLGASQDLQIYHDGTFNVIKGSSHQFFFENSANIVFAKVGLSETYLKMIPDGAVELYFDNSKKLETTSKGTKVTTTAVNINAEVEIEATNGGQSALRLKTSKSGTNRASRIDFHNQDSTTPKWTLINDFNQNGTNDFRLVDSGQASGNSIIAHQNGSVELYHDNSKKFETASYGAVTTGTFQATGNIEVFDNGKFIAGTGADLQIFHESSSSDNIIDCATTRPLRIRFGGTNQFEFFSSGGFKMNDGRKIVLGDSTDFTIFHNGSVGNIIDCRNAKSFFVVNDTDGGNETMIKAVPNGSVELYFNGNKKLQTTTNGVSITTGSLRVENGPAFAQNNGDAAATFDRLTSAGTLVELRFNGSNKGTITVGSSSASFNTTASDKTLKKNFESWNENVLNLFKNINPQKFNFIDQQDTDVKTKGYIAQDIVDSFPEAYPKGDDDKYMFNPSGMVVYLMKAIQELEAKVATLEAT